MIPWFIGALYFLTSEFMSPALFKLVPGVKCLEVD